jgi:hypothetical protein
LGFWAWVGGLLAGEAKQLGKDLGRELVDEGRELVDEITAELDTRPESILAKRAVSSKRSTPPLPVVDALCEACRKGVCSAHQHPSRRPPRLRK